MDNNSLTHYLEELACIVNIDSGSRSSAGISQLAAFFERKFAGIGWDVKRRVFDSAVGPCLEITNKPVNAYDVLLLGHLDTVFPDGTAVQRPFEIKGNRAYGPGVADMKAGLLLGYYALHKLMERPRRLSVCFAMNSEEEVGSKHTRMWMENLAQKSRCVFVLEPARANGALVIGRKGIGCYLLEFSGRSAHAGVEPEKGASAIGELGNWIVALHKLTNYESGITINVGRVSGGTAANVVADKAFAEVDFRFNGNSELSVIENTLSTLANTPRVRDVKVDVRGGVTRPPMVPTAKTEEICNLIEAIGASLDIQVKWAYTGGGSDGNFAAALGVPTIDGLGVVGGNTHHADEYIEIDSIRPRYHLLLQSILQAGFLGIAKGGS